MMSGPARAQSWREYFGWTRPSVAPEKKTDAPAPAAPRKTYRDALLGTRDAALLDETYCFV